MEITQPLLEIRDLTVTFGAGKHSTVVVNGVSFTVNRGKTLGVVGQSGSGKTTLARAIMQLTQKPYMLILQHYAPRN